MDKNMTKQREYGDPSGDPNLGEEASKNIDEITDHIERYFGDGTVFHEIVSDYVHIDVHIVKPTDEKPYYTLITSGMSDRPMKIPEGGAGFEYAEIMMALPPDWKIEEDDLNDERNWWPFRQLKQTARFPHVHETWLWYAHTIANENPPEPFADGVDFCGGILSCPMLCPEEAHTLEIDDNKTIQFLTFIPLYLRELQYAWEQGSDKLFERLDEWDLDELVQVGREAVI
jgi:hypothetical protein